MIHHQPNQARERVGEPPQYPPHSPVVIGDAEIGIQGQNATAPWKSCPALINQLSEGIHDRFGVGGLERGRELIPRILLSELTRPPNLTSMPGM
jgi:hypothetical protein